MLREIISVALGGALGSVLRYLAGRCAAALHFTSFPAATLTVNLLGCLLIGIFYGIFEKSTSNTANAFFVIGLCGGFTTFSSFAGEILKMTDRSEWLASAIYLAASIFFGILLVALGRWMTKI